MKTVHLHLAITLDDDAVKAVAELLTSLTQQTMQTQTDEEASRQARLRAYRNAMFAGEKPPEDQGLLLDSRQAARLLKVSARMLWGMSHNGQMPPPIRIGRAVRWSVDTLRRWVEFGCPRTEQA
jgi:predicted DNA-binding transcriptional regulator AlpA